VIHSMRGWGRGPEPHVRDVVSFAYVRRGSAGAARHLFKRHRTSLDAYGGVVAEVERVCDRGTAHCLQERCSYFVPTCITLILIGSGNCS
jgi:hypothetical protein